MNLIDILDYATDKKRFSNLGGFIDFCTHYLAYIDKHLQAKIISKNENHYQFFQYDNWGSYQITRPINSNLFYSIADFERRKKSFSEILKNAKGLDKKDAEVRETINRTVYTIQQSIGASLDALPPGTSNKARKINGDLFEHFIRLIIREIGIECNSGVVQVPVIVNGNPLFNMSYQHDLIVKKGDNLKMLGTIKTSSKDRLDKMFVDKFLYSRLTETTIPHVAIILNDVQRKKSKKENEYGINATFLPGHFKGYTVKLNPLDGVYYCDIRPNMRTETILKDHIKTFDNLLTEDIWKFV
jgi:hypothetical protein